MTDFVQEYIHVLTENLKVWENTLVLDLLFEQFADKCLLTLIY